MKAATESSSTNSRVSSISGSRNTPSMSGTVSGTGPSAQMRPGGGRASLDQLLVIKRAYFCRCMGRLGAAALRPRQLGDPLDRQHQPCLPARKRSTRCARLRRAVGFDTAKGTRERSHAHKPAASLSANALGAQGVVEIDGLEDVDEHFRQLKS